MKCPNEVIYPVSRHFLRNNADRPRPLIFLAGPIRGGLNWQARAQEYLMGKTPAAIANPLRPDLTKEQCRQLHIPWERYSKEAQVDWEIEHMRYAFKNGCLMFWLAAESKHDCTYPFAQSTRFELGFFIGKAVGNTARLVIGIDPSFPGREYIEHTIRRLQPSGTFEFCTSLKETCIQAIIKASRK